MTGVNLIVGDSDHGRMAVPEPVSLYRDVAYAQMQTNCLGVTLDAVS
jgi:hypothetical protein